MSAGSVDTSPEIIAHMILLVTLGIGCIRFNENAFYPLLVTRVVFFDDENEVVRRNNIMIGNLKKFVHHMKL